MKKEDLVFVRDMVNAIEKILRYLGSVGSLTEFLNNEMVVDAVTRNYEIVGEAAKKVPNYIKDRFPQVPWKQMYGLRNFAVHEYHIIDPTILWEIAEDHLPQNLIHLEEILTELG